MREKFEERECVTIENEGQKIFGTLHRPLHIPKPPAILMCHGLAGNKTGKFRVYVQLAERLAKAGIACLRVDFRGSGDSEGNFSDVSLNSEVSDALKALHFLQTHKALDAARIGIFGRSLGGLIALKAGRLFGHVKSMVAWAPLFDGQQWKEQWNIVNTSNLSQKERLAALSVNGQVPSEEFFNQLFNTSMDEELHFLDAIPFLHIHGEQDAVVEISHAEKYESLRKQTTAKNDFVRLPNSDHDFSSPDERRSAIDMTCEWFINTL